MKECVFLGSYLNLNKREGSRKIFVVMINGISIVVIRECSVAGSRSAPSGTSCRRSAVWAACSGSRWWCRCAPAAPADTSTRSCGASSPVCSPAGPHRPPATRPTTTPPTGNRSPHSPPRSPRSPPLSALTPPARVAATTASGTSSRSRCGWCRAAARGARCAPGPRSAAAALSPTTTGPSCGPAPVSLLILFLP